MTELHSIIKKENIKILPRKYLQNENEIQTNDKNTNL